MTSSPPAPSPVWRVRVHEALASTSDLCRQLAEAGEPGGLAVLARRQTAGRGTHGRGWESPEGNLYLSVLLRPGGPIATAPRWGLLAAVVVAEALVPLLPEPDLLRLKWPNDVLLGDGKIAGVLAEAAADRQGGLAWLVIGIGVNLASAPSLPDRLAACVGTSAPSADRFAADLLSRLDAWRARLAAEGFAPVRQAWLTRGPAPGTAVALHQGAAVRQGAFAGLDEGGALLLSADGHVRAFAAGET